MLELALTVNQIRQDFENKNIDQEKLAELYAPCLPLNTDVFAFLEKAAELFPKWNCGVATAWLKYKLNMGTVINGMYEDHPHTYLMLDQLTCPNEKDENYIIDITADQFGGPPIYIGRLVYPWSLK